MKTPTLAPVYLDNEPVSLMGDPKPQVSKVVAATGKRPEKFDIKLLTSESDTQGETVALDYVIDRTEEPAKAIYLTAVEKESDSLGAEGAEGGKSTGFGSSWGSSKGSGNSGNAGFGKTGSTPGNQPAQPMKGGSGQGNQGFGSGSATPSNQGTSTQGQGSYGQGKGLSGGVGTSSQTAAGKTQNLGSKPSGQKATQSGKTGGGSEDEWPVQGGSGNKSGSGSGSDEDIE
jgi:hypothetical protein